MNRLRTGLIALVILTAFLFWWFHPNQALKRRTKGLMQTLTLVEGTGSGSRNLKIGPLSRAIADQVTISGAGDQRAEGIFHRDSIESGFAWLATNARSTRFQIRRIESVTITGDTGIVQADIEAQVILPREIPLDGNYSMTLTWQNDGSAWRLIAAEWQPS